MKIRSIQEKDIVQVRELLSKSTPYVLPHHHYIYWMMAHYYSESNIVAIEKGNVVGYLCAVPEEKKNCYFIWQIVVDSQMRNKGIGEKMMDVLIKLAEENEIPAVELTIDKNNKTSQNFYNKYAEKLGSSLEEIGEYRQEGNYDIVYRLKMKKDI